MAKSVYGVEMLCTCSKIAQEHQPACQQLTSIADLHVAKSNVAKPESEPTLLPQPQSHPDLVKG